MTQIRCIKTKLKRDAETELEKLKDDILKRVIKDTRTSKQTNKENKEGAVKDAVKPLKMQRKTEKQHNINCVIVTQNDLQKLKSLSNVIWTNTQDHIQI